MGTGSGAPRVGVQLMSKPVARRVCSVCGRVPACQKTADDAPATLRASARALLTASGRESVGAPGTHIEADQSDR